MADGGAGPCLILATDLDDTLVGELEGLRALWRELDRLEPYRLIYLTGRSLESARSLMDEARLPVPDALASDDGSQVWHPAPDRAFVEDEAWAARLEPFWDGSAVEAAAGRIEGLERQPVQARFRVSFWLTRPEAEVIPTLQGSLEQAGLPVQVVVSGGLDVDILPLPAGKGEALRYLVARAGWPSARVVACGDSGNDRSMLAAGFPAVVVGNHRRELDTLQRRPRIYFARGRAAWGILEGLRHYGWPVDSHLPPALAT